MCKFNKDFVVSEDEFWLVNWHCWSIGIVGQLALLVNWHCLVGQLVEFFVGGSLCLTGVERQKSIIMESHLPISSFTYSSCSSLKTCCDF